MEKPEAARNASLSTAPTRFEDRRSDATTSIHTPNAVIILTPNAAIIHIPNAIYRVADKVGKLGIYIAFFSTGLVRPSVCPSVGIMLFSLLGATRGRVFANLVSRKLF